MPVTAVGLKLDPRPHRGHLNFKEMHNLSRFRLAILTVGCTSVVFNTSHAKTKRRKDSRANKAKMGVLAA